MAGLTTHILDLTHGSPASNVTVELFEVNNDERRWLKTAVTNGDGRLDEPLISGNHMKIGSFELVFYVGDYFRSKGMELTEPPFLDQVPVRFGKTDKKSHYHVPLLISPFGYQVYRGS